MKGRVLVGGLVFAAACATSSPNNQCDPSTSSCTLDASTTGSDAPTIDAPADAPLAGFGDPCTDINQCQSHICILVATGGVCSEQCASDCPAGWGCFGVTGAVDPGQVSNVCVPISDQLCSPCVADSECTLVGMDTCVTETSGRSYCARDCSTVSCPSGYDCQQQGATKECVPHSGACDCNVAAQSGASEACTITTPLSTQCAGTSTCAGVGGWGTCQPPSQSDSPDAGYVDSNCDGIDGDAAKGIFVAGGGANTATCGLAFNAPCQTISFGIIRGVQESRPNVYVQAGTYHEVIVMQSGVNVWGGYDFNWQRGPYSTAANRVTVVGMQDTTTGGDSEYLTVRAHDLIVGATIDDLVLQGPIAQGTAGTSGRDGRSSYVVHAKGVNGLTLSHVQIQVGSGASGATGTAGLDASLVDASSFMTGGTGGNGDQYTTVCNNSARGGGGAVASNSCAGPSSRSTTGGAGGQGGTMDTDCGVFSADFNARAGDNGTNAALTSGSFGLHGNGGSGGGSCGPTTNGNPGFVANGGAGSAASLLGYLGGASSAYWYAYAGGAGGTGENGTGGGGGGGGGGCDNGTDAYGAGGGGGGAGGCAARGGGGGGGGGGGAFGVFAVGSSTVTIATCDLQRGVGGAGGTGGTGGRGQSGGGAGPGGSAHPNSATPGNGGAGAHGGHGGGGGGGQGGRSVGILRAPDSTVNGTCTQSQGLAGAGGTGGASAPNAPAVERDGANGATGTNGALEDTRVCTSGSNC